VVTSAALREDPGYIRGLLRPGDRLVAADGGAAVTLALGLVPDLVVGDLDSLDPAVLAAIPGCPVRTFPARKDKTDTHLALEAALEWQPAEVVVCGAFGDRFDHSLGLVLLVAGAPWRPAVRLRSARQEAFAVRGGDGPALVRGRPGDVVSLLPLSQVVRGVTTSGLGYPLCRGELRWGETLGVSNEMLADEATVEVEEGCLLVVRLDGAW